MSSQPGEFRIGELRVDPQGGEISGPGGQAALDPKVMGVLVMLAEHAGHVVAREDLLARLWPDVVVTDDALSRCIYELRRQLGTVGASEEFRALIETLPKRGYRLNAEVTPIAARPADSPAGRRGTRVAAWAVVAAAIAVAIVLVARLVTFDGPRASVAVLPFADLSETQDQAYLADGVAEEILDKLNQSTDLRVIARTSSFTFRGKSADIAEIARKLDVTHVLEGSVRRAGDDLRVTAQLIATSDSSHVWSTTFERKLGDLFAIQDEIAVAVASALQASLELDRSGSAPSPKLAAYELVKQAEYAYQRRAPGDVQHSVELLEQALEIDPSYARAWANLAGAYSLQAWSADPPSEVLRAKQGNAAIRAVELDPSLALGHARLAQYYWEANEPDMARQHFDRAHALDPGDPLVLGYISADAIDTGDFDAAIKHQRAGLLRDPLNSVARQNLGVVLMAAGRLDEALSNYRTLLELNPDVGPNVEVEISRILALQGRADEAAAAAMRLPPGEFRDHAMALLHGSSPHRKEADAALRRFADHVSGDSARLPDHAVMDSVRLAETYAFLGSNDEAFATLTTRLEELEKHPEAAAHTWYLRHECRVAPFLKPLHADPRWSAFMAEPA
jgi:TolB-like protein/DNA-binding winged helix-turn-helix (wHTH) protein/Tfp pilus assembly protein PilF